MPWTKTLWVGVTCLLAYPSLAGALLLGVRDEDQGGPRTHPTGPPAGVGPPTDLGNGRRPTSYLPFWSPPPTTTPLTMTAPATSSVHTTPAAGATTTSPVVVSRSTTAVPTSSASSAKSSISISSPSPLPASSAASATIATMPSDVSSSPAAAATGSNGNSGPGSSRTLTITLSTVLSVVGAAVLVGAVMICLKCRRKRVPFFARGISPIDDDEIATWKTSRDEKAALARAGAAAGTRAPGSGNYTTRKHTSAGSIRKPPSVIVYQGRHSQQLPRPSGEGSPRSLYNSPGSNGRTSFDKEVQVQVQVPQTPILAVAPNARAGLTDETVPGDDPFLPSPKRHPSRLSKVPPNLNGPRGNQAHTRTRSSRSSMRSFGGGDYGYYTAGSDMQLSPRTSNDYYSNVHHGHSRVYSSSSIPPRLSFGDDGVAGGLSPRPLFRDDNDMIGRAIG